VSPLAAGTTSGEVASPNALLAVETQRIRLSVWPTCGVPLNRRPNSLVYRLVEFGCVIRLPSGSGIAEPMIERIRSAA
jgi:hypothetical protein